ncbi:MULTISPECIES: hypothetical protein [Streptomyces]|uniref:Uncharacterized protein n=1 Tax=Streptomyces lunalinharesii TaxID=333384 RepID=A0ABN3R611_9ACTN|nr:hypothetical protein [Streptomyces noursei]
MRIRLVIAAVALAAAAVLAGAATASADDTDSPFSNADFSVGNVYSN